MEENPETLVSLCSSSFREEGDGDILPRVNVEQTSVLLCNLFALAGLFYKFLGYT
jgi:hypothetical protein